MGLRRGGSGRTCALGERPPAQSDALLDDAVGVDQVPFYLPGDDFMELYGVKFGKFIRGRVLR